MQTIKAQDVAIGTNLAEVTVAKIKTFTCGNGDRGYRFFGADGFNVWNRHGEELVLAA